MHASNDPAPQGSGSDPQDGSNSVPKSLRVRDLLAPTRVQAGLEASSKKSLLDRIASEFHDDRPDLDERDIFQTLLRREQLGSTALGHGVALPHGRLPDLDHPLGALLRLAEPTDFDAIDEQPVSLVFALLVPDEENEQHLNILARLARMLDDPTFRQELLEAPEEELFDRLVAKDDQLAEP